MDSKSIREAIKYSSQTIFKRRLNVIWNDVLESSSSKELGELLHILQDFEHKQLYSIMDPETLKKISSMIIQNEIEELHGMLIDKFGGSSGIRDKEALQSALSRPFLTFNQKELHVTVINKAADLMESILSNHPFVDGNKRTGYLTIRLFLITNRYDIVATLNNKFDFVMNIAAGNTDFNVISDWLYKNTKRLNQNYY